MKLKFNLIHCVLVAATAMSFSVQAQDGSTVVIGKNDWLFTKYEFANPADASDTQATIQMFEKINKMFERKGIALARQGLMWRAPIGGLVAMASFGAILLATRLDKVGEAAVLRETSTIFAALIGWLFLKETVGPRRLALMALIALGAVIVEFAG